MGIFNLFGFCIALLFAPALAFANDVRVGVSPTTGYYEVTSKTFNVPKGASVSSSKAVSTVVTPLTGGGFQQSMGGGITIEGLKQPAPFTARAAASLKTMKNAAKKLARSNPARFAAGAGIGVLLDSLDWLIKDGQIVQKTEDLSIYLVDSNFLQNYPSRIVVEGGVSKGSPPLGEINVVFHTFDDPFLGSYHSTCKLIYNQNHFIGAQKYGNGARCYYDSLSQPRDFPDSSLPPFKEISNSQLEDVIDRSYAPFPSDFVLLTPHMSPDFILVDPIPSVITDLGITNTFDSSGWLTGTEQKTATTDFTVSNNSSAQPSISSSTSVKTETFKDGKSQGSTVTNTTQPAVGGGGGGKAPTVEIPTDCDFHPTLCAWMNWTKEPLEEPDHDLKQIMHTVDFEEKKTISFGSKACPAPYDIHLGLIDRTYQLSFQPACDFAGYLYFFVMAAAYIFAAYISVGVVRNG